MSMIPRMENYPRVFSPIVTRLFKYFVWGKIVFVSAWGLILRYGTVVWCLVEGPINVSYSIKVKSPDGVWKHFIGTEQKTAAWRMLAGR